MYVERKARLMMSDISEELIAYATDASTIYEQAGLSILERVTLIKKRFKLPGFKSYHL